MRRYWSNFKYVLSHKWFVFVAGLKIGASPWRLIIHDLSKFTFGEFFAYAGHFYNEDGTRRMGHTNYLDDMKLPFEGAWLRHQHRNLHHWQAWISIGEGGKLKPYPMPEVYVKEMIADWMGAGRAITGNWDNYKSWWIRNRDGLFLHEETRKCIERLLGEATSVR